MSLKFDRWFEIDLEYFHPKRIESSVSQFMNRIGPFFEESKGKNGISLIVEFHGDNIHRWNNNLYAKLPITMEGFRWTYQDLKKLIHELKNNNIFLAQSVQCNFFEFDPSEWIHNIHPELGIGIRVFNNLFQELRPDNLKYAAFPNGIPPNSKLKYYDFFANQWGEFSSQFDLDYLFMRDGWLGRSFQRDEPINIGGQMEEKTAKYVEVFKLIKEKSKTGIITWTTGMSGSPFHSAIDLHKILPYIDIYITQSYASAWDRFWNKFSRIPDMGGYIPQIIYSLLNKAFLTSRIKHYVLIDAWDWEGWNGFHVNRDSARGHLWNMALTNLKIQNDLKFPDGIWIGQCMNYFGLPLYRSDFEWINNEIKKIEKNKYINNYGLGWVPNVKSFKKVIKNGPGINPDIWYDTPIILKKCGTPISYISNLTEEQVDGLLIWNPYSITKENEEKILEIMKKIPVIFYGEFDHFSQNIKNSINLPIGLHLFNGKYNLLIPSKKNIQIPIQKNAILHNANSLCSIMNQNIKIPNKKFHFSPINNFEVIIEDNSHPVLIKRPVDKGVIILSGLYLTNGLDYQFLGALLNFLKVHKIALVSHKEFDFGEQFEKIQASMVNKPGLYLIKKLIIGLTRKYSLMGLLNKYFTKFKNFRPFFYKILEVASQGIVYSNILYLDRLISMLGFHCLKINAIDLVKNFESPENFDTILIGPNAFTKDLAFLFQSRKQILEKFVSNGGKLIVFPNKNLRKLPFCDEIKVKTTLFSKKTKKFKILSKEFNELLKFNAEHCLIHKKNNTLTIQGTTLNEIPRLLLNDNFFHLCPNASILSKIQTRSINQIIKNIKVESSGPISVNAFDLNNEDSDNYQILIIISNFDSQKDEIVKVQIHPHYLQNFKIPVLLKGDDNNLIEEDWHYYQLLENLFWVKTTLKVEKGDTKIIKYKFRNGFENLPHIIDSNVPILQTGFDNNTFIINLFKQENQGKLRIWTENKPDEVLINNSIIEFKYENEILTINIPNIIYDHDSFLNSKIIIKFNTNQFETSNIKFININNPKIAVLGKRYLKKLFKKLHFQFTYFKSPIKLLKELKNFNILFCGQKSFKSKKIQQFFLKNAEYFKEQIQKGLGLIIFDNSPINWLDIQFKPKKIKDFTIKDIEHQVFAYPHVACPTPDANGFYIKYKPEWVPLIEDFKSKNPTWILGALGKGKISISTHLPELYITHWYPFDGPNYHLLKNTILWCLQNKEYNKN